VKDDFSGIICFVGVGSNMDDPAVQCAKAIDHLAAIPGVKLLRRSSFYRTEPVGSLCRDWFINAVVEMRTALTAGELLRELRGIEKRMGRKKVEKWGPRIIDLDILFYGQDVIQEVDLVIPHPELHRRRFALTPLYEIAPYAIHPAFGVSVRGLMERLEDDRIAEVWEKEKTL